MYSTLNRLVRPYSNVQNEVVVDLERGIVVDSRALNEEQFNRYFRTVPTASRPDMNFRQASEFFRTLHCGERFLELQAKLLNHQIGRLFKIGGPQFVRDNADAMYGTAMAQLTKPLIQRTYATSMRTNYESEQIVNYTQRILQHLKELSLIRELGASSVPRNVAVDKVKKALRAKYLKPTGVASSE